MIKVLQPEYVSKFTCISSDCEDTCCSGWRVAIDETSYKKYQNLINNGEAKQFSGKITRDIAQQVKGAFAEVVLQDNRCPFLTDEKLCHIQKTHGESYLSVTCSIFPRNYNMVNGQLELSLDFSCPHAARLALLDPLPMRFSLTNVQDDPRINRIPTLSLSDTKYPNRMYPYFNEVRAFVIALLQNGNYDFENRLIILGRFCDDLNRMTDPSEEEVLQLVHEYTDLLDTFGFREFFASIPTQPAAMLKTLMILIEYRLKTGVAGKRFLECIDQFKQGLRYTSEMPDGVIADNYQEMQSKYYDNYMQQHGHIFENYFVNYVFKTIFPFGPQTRIHGEEIFTVNKTVFTEYMLLALHYSMIKNILVGMAGYFKEQFDEQQVLKLIQSFDKSISHDIPYLQKLLQFLEENNSLNIVCAVMLIKN